MNDIRGAYTSPEDFDTNFVGLGRSYFDIFDGQWLARFPGYGSLPRNQLPSPSLGITHTLHVIVFPVVSDILRIQSIGDRFYRESA
jgi:hypothetical protein